VLAQPPSEKAFRLQISVKIYYTSNPAQLGDGRGTSSMAQVDNKLPIKVQGKKEREDAIMSRAEREKVRNITSTAKFIVK